MKRNSSLDYQEKILQKQSGKKDQEQGIKDHVPAYKKHIPQ
jgi:hypothetical protein